MNTSITKTFLFVIFLLYAYAAYTQTARIDSLKKVLSSQKEDTNKVNTLNNLSFWYTWSSADTGLAYAQKALDLAEKLNFEQGILNAEISLGGALTVLGNYPLSLDYGFKALFLAKKIGRPFPIMQANGNLGECYYYLGEYNTSLKYFRENSKLSEQFFRDQPYFVWVFMCKVFEGMRQPDSAILYGKKAYEKINRIKDWNEKLNYGSLICPILGNAFAGKNEYDSALFYYRMGIPLSIQNHTETDMIDCYNGIATVYKAKGNPDSAVWYAKKVLNEKITKTYPIGLLKATNILSDIYQSQNKPDSTLKYLRIALSVKDRLIQP